MYDASYPDMTGRVFDFPGATVALLSFNSTHLHGIGINFRLPGVIEYGWFSPFLPIWTIYKRMTRFAVQGLQGPTCT